MIDRITLGRGSDAFNWKVGDVVACWPPSGRLYVIVDAGHGWLTVRPLRRHERAWRWLARLVRRFTPRFA